MARYKGTFAVSANYEPLVAAPFDARQLVETKADLTSTSTWVRADGSFWTYPGMVVSVAQDINPDNNGIYVLINEDFTLDANWRKSADERDIKELRSRIEELSGGSNLDVDVETEADLPAIGDSNVTYYVKENLTIQRWDESSGTYLVFGNIGEIPELNINIIYGGNANGAN